MYRLLLLTIISLVYSASIPMNNGSQVETSSRKPSSTAGIPLYVITDEIGNQGENSPGTGSQDENSDPKYTVNDTEEYSNQENDTEPVEGLNQPARGGMDMNRQRDGEEYGYNRENMRRGPEAIPARDTVGITARIPVETTTKPAGANSTTTTVAETTEEGGNSTTTTKKPNGSWSTTAPLILLPLVVLSQSF